MAKSVKNIFSIASLLSAMVSAGMFSTSPEKLQAQFNKIIHSSAATARKPIKQPVKKHLVKFTKRQNET
jgi:hypothetical protein